MDSDAMTDPARTAALAIIGYAMENKGKMAIEPVAHILELAQIIRSAFAEPLKDVERLEAILSAKETRCYAYTWDEEELAGGALQSIPRRIKTREELDEVLGEEPDDE